jgi:hypothetical protein
MRIVWLAPVAMLLMFSAHPLIVTRSVALGWAGAAGAAGATGAASATSATSTGMLAFISAPLSTRRADRKTSEMASNLRHFSAAFEML